MALGVELAGVSKRYSGKLALSNVSLNINSGELLAILGPSGSGKSTLLRIMNLLEKPDGGEVGFVENGSRIQDEGVLRRRMTLLLQRPIMMKDSVYGNVAYGLRLRHVSEGQIMTKVAAALDDMGLGGLERRRAYTLSGGEMQRVAFARAAVLEPELLLLDEFTANLDPPNIKMLESALTRYRTTKGCTVAMVSHNPFQAQRLAKRCIFLCQGEVLGSGTLDEVRETKDERIAEFFRGDML